MYCNTLKPGDGMVLHCMHIICENCLSDSIRDPGCVKCAACGEVTSCQRRGVHLSQQLVKSFPLLYPSELDVSRSVDDYSNTGLTLGAPRLKRCEGCSDLDIEKEASVQCVDCGGELMCDRHAQ